MIGLVAIVCIGGLVSYFRQEGIRHELEHPIGDVEAAAMGYYARYGRWPLSFQALLAEIAGGRSGRLREWSTENEMAITFSHVNGGTSCDIVVVSGRHRFRSSTSVDCSDMKRCRELERYLLIEKQ
jgi:hypothetical protein